jgi:tRNA pseudouridine38-40 synthase
MGTTFVGWQRQPQGVSVQKCLEEALFAFCQEPVVTHAAGRTDSGVHAQAQVVHFDISRPWPPFKVRDAVNYHLKPHPIALLEVEEVPDTFHARFSAVGRSYEYQILNRYAPLALDKGRVWRISRPLDTELMQRGADLLVGTHDFTTFRSTECQAASPVKTLDIFDIRQEGSRIICFLKSRSFLHHQVRNMVGTLVKVGLQQWSLEKLQHALEAKDRRCGGPMAPADGLYFHKAYYD